MNEFVIVIVVFVGFALGFALAWFLFYMMIYKPLFDLYNESIETLKTSNRDNLKLLKQRNTDFKKPPLHVQFKLMSKEEFLNVINQNHDNEPEFNEKQFLINELTKLGAVGWSKDDDIETLRKLYDIL